MKPTGVFSLFRSARFLALMVLITALVIGAGVTPSSSLGAADSSHPQLQPSVAPAKTNQDRTQSLTDQTVEWNTFLGSDNVDVVSGAIIDQSGNLYVSGSSRASWGSPIRAHNGGDDVFVVKLDSSGRLLWSTFLGASGYRQTTRQMLFDNSGNLLVAVLALSGPGQGGIAKLDPAGNLISTTLIPHTEGVVPPEFALDGSGNFYIAASSQTTFGSPVRPYSGQSDAMVEKMDPSGNVIWNTFLGGDFMDFPSWLVVRNGHVYVQGGSTKGWGSPLRDYTFGFGGRQPTYDGFVAELDSSSGALIWNTFLGGVGQDTLSRTALDGTGNLYLVGSSSATWGSPVRAFPDGEDALVAKLDSSGHLIWNTFTGFRGLSLSPGLNYNNLGFGYGLTFDGSGNLYVTGLSGGFRYSSCPHYPRHDDGFVVKLDTSGQEIWHWSPGGNADRVVRALAFDATGNAYVVGESDASWGAPVRAFSSGLDSSVQGFPTFDAFAAKIRLAPVPAIVEFSSPSYSVNEGTPQVNIVVNRSGDTTNNATVTFATTDSVCLRRCDVFDGQASSHCDYLARSGSLEFAPGETSKSFSLPIVDDSYAEGNEDFVVSLVSATSAFLGPQAIARVTITDNDSVSGTNPINSPNPFVRQHYFDFLNREPDASGFAFWTNEIISCGADQPCLEVKRVNVSAAFYLSIEFQQTGYLVERVYKAAYGDATGNSQLGTLHLISVPAVRLAAFLADIQEIGKGVVVNQGNWQQQLENNKQAFVQEFVLRPEFTPYYPTSQTPTQFVNLLFTHAGLPQSGPDYTAAINEFGSATSSADPGARARVLRRVAENSTFVQQELNRAFVLMEYFGYLRRNPDNFPDADFTGYDFWLTKLNQFNGNFVNADMVKAFITSGEYRQRFGPP